MDMESYLVPGEYGEAELVEKRSRFIGQVWRVETEEEARERVEQVRKKYHDARHHCWCYLLREGGVLRYSDDGEPQGTAGIPVIDTMKKSGVTDAVIVATRYFGGILLGGGGLIRAYSHTASIALGAAERVRMKQCLKLGIACSYDSYGRVQAIVPECGGIVDGAEFTDKVTISLHMEPELLEGLMRRLADATAGRAALERAGEEFYPLPVE